jgi:hypothetical protein
VVETAPAQHSADLEWWWAEGRWHQAWSEDRQWWFDGATWRAVVEPLPRRAGASAFRLTPSEVVVGGLSFLVWVVGVIWAAIAVPEADATGELSTAAAVAGVALLAVSVLGIAATAGWLAWRARWPQVGLLAIYMVGLLLGWYVAMMLAVPVPAGQPDAQDDLAAVGLIFLVIPTAFVVGLLTCVGAAIGAVARALLRRRRPAAFAT